MKTHYTDKPKNMLYIIHCKHNKYYLIYTKKKNLHLHKQHNNLEF